MAEIYVAVRNQQRVSMTSVNGTAIIVLLASSGQVVDQQAADLTTAMVAFRHLPAGTYTLLVRHLDLTPTEARIDYTLTAKTILGVRFVYNEPQSLLADIQIEVNELP